MKKLIAIIAALSAMMLALPAMAGGEDRNPSEPVRTFMYSLNEVADNEDDGSPSGTVRLTALPNGKIQVKIEAQGLTPGVHAQHIHGIEGNDGFVPGACPTIANDGDLGRPVDGLIDTVEGVLDYGFVRQSLTTTGDTSPGSALDVTRFPIADQNGVLEYERTFTPTDSRVWSDLGAVEVVIHGIDLDDDGQYPLDFFDSNSEPEERRASSLSDAFPLEATIPVLCGGPGT